jgi:UDP-2-acetamido-3-amino-2,3-dideoxy-glucuronate N-acetyltransferase
VETLPGSLHPPAVHRKSGPLIYPNPRKPHHFKDGLYQMAISKDVVLGQDVVIHHPDLVNLYGCNIGDGTKVGTFVEIQKNVSIGARCKISSHSFICEGVTIEDEVFVGHGVMFTNDLFPRSTSASGALQTDSDWNVIPTLVRNRASIGSGVTLLCGITIGEDAMVGAGAVVTADVPAGVTVMGVPARPRRTE